MRPAGSRSDDVPPPSALAEGHLLAPQQLSPYLRRRLASPLAVAIKRKKWVPHRRTLGDAPTGVGARGTGFARPEPTTETINRFIHSVVTEAYPKGTSVTDDDGGALELSGRVYDAYAYYTDQTGYAWFLQDLTSDGLLESWQRYLHSSEYRAPFVPRSPTPQQPLRRMVRNGRYVSEEAALAAERLPDYCVIWRLSARAIEAHCDNIENGRAKRLPDLSVAIIEAAKYRAKQRQLREAA